MSVQHMSEYAIVRAINSGSIDDDDLCDSESWREICRARGRNFASVDPDAWSSLCARRGSVLYSGYRY